VIDKEAGSLTREQCRAGRALLDWTQGELAAQAAISEGTVRAFEIGKRALRPHNRAALREAMEAAGVAFIPADGGGGGVRLTKRQKRARSKRTRG
jgi:hypothetical protein